MGGRREGLTEDAEDDDDGFGVDDEDNDENDDFSSEAVSSNADALRFIAMATVCISI